MKQLGESLANDSGSLKHRFPFRSCPSGCEGLRLRQPEAPSIAAHSSHEDVGVSLVLFSLFLE
jgi:hypothetical protein